MPSNYDAMNGYVGDVADVGSSEIPTGSRSKAKEAHKRKLERVAKAKKLRSDNEWDERWAKFISIYSNEYAYEELGESYKDIVAPNMAFSTVNVIVPSVSVRTPKITVSAKREADVEASEAVEAVVNHQWRQYGVQEQVSRAVKDFVVIGHGWVKVTWETRTEERELSIEEWQDQVREALLERATAIQQSGMAENEFPTVDEVVQSIPRMQTVTVKDAPLVRRVSPFDMFVDPDATTLDDARWIAQRVLVPIEVARKNPEWRQSARAKLKKTAASEIRKDMNPDWDAESHSDEQAFVVIYEYYDLLDGTWCVMADGLDDYLKDPVKSVFPKVHPYEFVANYEVPERFYPIGDVEVIFSLQQELALTRTAMINDRKAGRRIHMIRENVWGPDGVEDLMSEKDNVMLSALDDTPFSEAYQVVSPTALHPEWYTQSEMIQRDIDTVSGVSEYARGTMPEIRRTATEAGLIQDAANSRSADKLYRVEQMMARVGERMILLTQKFMDGEDVARVVDDDLVVAWVTFNREKIAGEFAFEVEAGSTQPQNESFRRQAALQMMDAMAPFMGAGIVNMPKLMEYVMRHGFQVKNPEEFIMQPQMMDPAMMGGPEGMPGGVPGGMPQPGPVM